MTKKAPVVISRDYSILSFVEEASKPCLPRSNCLYPGNAATSSPSFLGVQRH